MRLLYCFFLFVVAFSRITKEEGVLVLNDNNFEEAVKQYNILLVEFYAPWNGKSQKFASDYAAAAKELSEIDESFTLAKVNCIHSPRLVKEYSLRRFPTLKFFRNGIVTDYNENIDKDTIVSYVQQMAVAPSTALHSTSELKRFIEGKSNVLVGFFESTESEEFQEWASALTPVNNEQLTIHVTSEEVAEDMEVEIPSIHLYQGDLTHKEYTGKIKDLEKWLIVHSLPLVIPFSQVYSDMLFSDKHGIQTHLICITSNSNVNTVTPLLEKTALLFREKLFVIHLPKENIRLVDYLGAPERDVVLMIMDLKSKAKYLFSGTVQEEEIKQFVVDYFHGELKPYYKSEEDIEQVGSVTRLTGKTFKQSVFDSKMDAIVGFYSPVNHHFNEMKDLFDQLVKKYEKDNLLVAWMNASRNEVEGIVIRDIPSIQFFKAGNNKGVHFTGELTIEAVTEFIDSNRVDMDETDL